MAVRTRITFKSGAVVEVVLEKIRITKALVEWENLEGDAHKLEFINPDEIAAVETLPIE